MRLAALWSPFNCRCLVTTALWTCLFTLPCRAGLLEYVKASDPAFSWKLKEKISTEQGVIFDIHLVSQVWHDIKWEHQLQVYQPQGVEPNAKMPVYNTGGSANPGNIGFG